VCPSVEKESEKKMKKLTDLKHNELCIDNSFESLSFECLSLCDRLKRKKYNQTTIKALCNLKEDVEQICFWNIPQIKKVMLYKERKKSEKKEEKNQNTKKQ
tara:strand:+ start:232 stop:534 length:303 start_codon:yes stop_codon:yes gene_type:complete